MKKNSDLFPWFIVLYEIAIYLSMDCYLPAFPKIAHDLNVGTHMVQFTATVWIAGGLCLLPILGPLSERFGRRPVLFAGGVVYVLSSILCSLAANIHVLLFARLLQGMAMPTMVVGGYSVVNEYYESQKAIKTLALMNSVRILAPAFGPLLGSAFLLVANWRWIFAVLVFMSLIPLVCLYFCMPETIKSESSTPLKFKPTLIQYKKIITTTAFSCYSLVAVIPMLGMITWMISGPFLVVHVFHRSIMDFAVMQLLIFGCFILGNQIIKKLATEKNNLLFVKSGLGLALTASILTLTSSWLMPSHLFLFVFFIMLFEIGCGLFMPILSRLALEKSDAPMGLKVTVFTVYRMGSGTLGTLLLAWFYNGTLISIACIILCFTVIAYWLWVTFCKQCWE